MEQQTLPQSSQFPNSQPARKLIIMLLCAAILLLLIGTRFFSVNEKKDIITPTITNIQTPAELAVRSDISYPYYFTDTKGVWRKDAGESPILVYSSSKPASQYYSRKYMFSMIAPDLVVATYYDAGTGNETTELNECRYNISSKTANCTVVDQVHAWHDLLVSTIPNESAYIYFRRKPEKRGWFGAVHAQVPYQVEVIRRNHLLNTSDKVTSIEQAVGCGGGSWHSLYYHGYRRGITITSNGLILLSFGCEGEPGQHYVIDINQKKIIPGDWDFIAPREIDGGGIVFHRLEETRNQENKKERHVFYTAPITNLAQETKLFDLGPDKYVGDMTYSKSQKRIYLSYIYKPDPEIPQSTDQDQNDYKLRIASFNPHENAGPQDIFTTKGYFIDNLVPVGDNLLYYLSLASISNSVLKTPEKTYLLDLGTQTADLQADFGLIPASL